jgi:hypothetical protein
MAINWQEAAGTLAEEKSFAEEDARLLKTEAAGNRAALLQGQRLYAEAKAASDGLIARLLAVLADDRDPAGADDLKQAAERAFVSRLAFSRQVADALPDLTGTKSVLLDALAKPAVDLVKGLIEGGIAVWKEYRRGNELRRATLRAQLEQHKWRAFTEL